MGILMELNHLIKLFMWPLDFIQKAYIKLTKTIIKYSKSL